MAALIKVGVESPNGILITKGGFIMVKGCILSYPYIAAPNANEMYNGRYSATMSLTEGQYNELTDLFVAQYKKALNIVVTKKIKEGKNFPTYNDGADKLEQMRANFENKPENAGKEFNDYHPDFYIKPWSSKAPTVVDLYGDMVDASKIAWRGAEINVILKPYKYDKGGFTGYAFLIEKIQLITEGSQGESGTACDCDFGYSAKPAGNEPAQMEEMPF